MMYYILIIGYKKNHWFEYDTKSERDCWLQVLQQRFSDLIIGVF